jgi:hypothetical protein
LHTFPVIELPSFHVQVGPTLWVPSGLMRCRIKELCHWHFENPLIAAILRRALVHLHAKSNRGGFYVRVCWWKGWICCLQQQAIIARIAKERSIVKPTFLPGA